MLVVLALLATCPTASPRLLPSPSSARRHQLDADLMRTTARASCNAQRVDFSLANRHSVFSLAASDTEH
eukprot:1090689-Pleurochrysis_carterae.AAC.1